VHCICDRRAIHRNRFLVNKTNTCTEFQFYCYYYCTCFGQPFCPSSGVLSLQRLWYILCSCDEPFVPRVGWNCRRQIHPTPASKRSQLHKVYQSRCTAKNSWWWAERLSETCRVLTTIKLEFGSFVCFIHKTLYIMSRSANVMQPYISYKRTVPNSLLAKDEA